MIGVQLDAALLEAREKAVQPLAAAGVGQGRADEGDIPVAHAHQIPGGHITAAVIVEADPVGGGVQGLLDGHHRHIVGIDLLNPGGVVADGGDDDALDLLLQQGEKLLFLIFRVPVGIAEQHVIAAVNQGVVDTRDEAGVIEIGDVGDDHPHLVGPVGFEIPAQHIGLIFQLPDGGLHPGAQLGAHRIIHIVDDAGHRRHRHAAVLGHVIDGHLFLRHAPLPFFCF